MNIVYLGNEEAFASDCVFIKDIIEEVKQYIGVTEDSNFGYCDIVKGLEAGIAEYTDTGLDSDQAKVNKLKIQLVTIQQAAQLFDFKEGAEPNPVFDPTIVEVYPGLWDYPTPKQDQESSNSANPEVKTTGNELFKKLFAQDQGVVEGERNISKLMEHIKKIRDGEVANIQQITTEVLAELNLKAAEDLLPLGLISALKCIVGYNHTEIFKVTELSPEEAQKRLKFYGYLVTAQSFVISAASGYAEKMGILSDKDASTIDLGYMG